MVQADTETQLVHLFRFHTYAVFVVDLLSQFLQFLVAGEARLKAFVLLRLDGRHEKSVYYDISVAPYRRSEMGVSIQSETLINVKKEKFFPCSRHVYVGFYSSHSQKHADT